MHSPRRQQLPTLRDRIRGSTAFAQCALHQANVASLLPVPGNLVIAALLAPLIALAMLRNVAALAPFSLGADIAMISGAAAVGSCPMSCVSWR